MESTPGLAAPSVSSLSLAAAFATVPDPRRAASVVYPLAAILALAVAALLANHRSVLAMAEWGARQDPATLAALGFPQGRTPCQSTLQRLFRQLDGDALAATLAGWFGPQTTRAATAGAGEAEAELTVAPALLARIDWHGRVLTGDALFCQRTLCQQVRQAGGDYLLLVKDNQGTLHDDIRLLFDPPATVPAAPLSDRRVASTLETGHGRTMERRALIASTDLTDYLEWPGRQQVFRVERTWREHGQPKRTIRYGITSLAPDQADAARLLALRRGHWAIENQLHRHKDVNFGEDASLIHVGQGPTVLALLRDAALNLLHRSGIRRIASQLRTHSQHPERAVALVVGPLPTGA